jgi:hypothetical protein
MAWLIGIVCIVLVIKFWRIFLPLGLIAGVAIGLILLDAERTDRAQAKLEQQKLEQRKLKVQKVQRALNASPMKDTKWEISSETDPASGKPVPRTASVVSDNGLCRLQVEQRVDRTRLAGIYCDDLLIKDRYSATMSRS